MHPFLVAALLLTSTVALARDDAAVSVPDLIANPAKRIGESIVIRRIRCVDPGGAGLVCVAVRGRLTLRIEASLLGPFTKVDIAEKLIGLCKGEAKLDAAACTFDILITPKTTRQDDGTGGRGTVTVIYGNEIEMYAPRRM
ncbi:hypothetical protein [Methylobacterium sp. Leaf93]|uniref:hypothetical protein n=1 Tax=Methylobacterium sp. Leaf93 TaxID=1736249 RepID=UPI0006FDBEDC|nr:hypothetical protein [Methylobacterium sp. Leaf93]KQP16615.1 hypothetical protein ASF26_01940 [Methylobacterium sp. Leaf93]